MIKFLGTDKKHEILLYRKLENFIKGCKKTWIAKDPILFLDAKIEYNKNIFFLQSDQNINAFLIKISVVLFSLGIGQLDFKAHLEE